MTSCKSVRELEEGEMSKSVYDFDNRMGPLGGGDVVLGWHKVDEPGFRLAGMPWFERDRLFRRMPVAKPGELPEGVEWLCNCPAGGQAAFRTDSRHVAVRVKLENPADMNHMPSTGQCGFDLYVGPPGAMRFHKVSIYDHTRSEYEALLWDHPISETREFTLNFPLYKKVDDLRIGLDPEAQVLPPSPYAIDGRIVIYGTSITQGGCAARPGMAYTNILSRRLNAEVINLGFSGNGKGEPEVCRIFASIPNVRLFVLDYEANAVSLEQFSRTLPANIDIIRENYPEVPILVVSRIEFSYDPTHPESQLQREQTRDMQANVVREKKSAGDHNIWFLDGGTLLGEDAHECTVDGVHPTDLGFLRIANAMEPMVREILRLKT